MGKKNKYVSSGKEVHQSVVELKMEEPVEIEQEISMDETVSDYDNNNVDFEQIVIPITESVLKSFEVEIELNKEVPIIEEIKPTPKAIILENFTMPIPMQGHLSTVCTVSFKKGQEITDEYVANYLKTTSKSNLVKFI